MCLHPYILVAQRAISGLGRLIVWVSRSHTIRHTHTHTHTPVSTRLKERSARRRDLCLRITQWTQ